jgi:hypothetical protein
MEGFYATPFERFERYAPHGRADDVAAAAVPYVDAGCRSINLIVANTDPWSAVAGAAEVAALVRSASRPAGAAGSVATSVGASV